MSDEPPIKLRDPNVKRLPGTEGKPRIWQPVLDGDGELDIPIASDRDTRCRHRHILVQTDRRVLCRDCERHIDPVDYVLELARDFAWLQRCDREARSKIRALQKDVDELERQERNAKSRLRRARPEELEAARKAVEQARRAIWRTSEALRSLGIDDEVIYGPLRLAGERIEAADVALTIEPSE